MEGIEVWRLTKGRCDAHAGLYGQIEEECRSQERLGSLKGVYWSVQQF